MNKTMEDQWRNAERKLAAEKEVILKREAVSESRVRELQNTAEQLRMREQALEREKLLLEVQLGKEHESTLKWKRQATQWKHHITKKAKAASERAAAPGSSKERRQWVNRKAQARTALFKAIKNVGTAYKPGDGPLTAKRIQLGMQKVLATKTFMQSIDELGSPADWLPPKVRKEMQDAKVRELKASLTDPVALSRAKDHAGISDARARTLLLDLLPDRSWVPSGASLQQARTNTNRSMQVSNSSLISLLWISTNCKIITTNIKHHQCCW